MIFCTAEHAPTYSPSDNAVNVVNEVRVDNKDSETWLAIIALIQIIMLVMIVLTSYKKSLKKKYSPKPASII